MSDTAEVTEPITQEATEAAEKYKNEANDFFKSKTFFLYFDL